MTFASVLLTFAVSGHILALVTHLTSPIPSLTASLVPAWLPENIQGREAMVLMVRLVQSRKKASESSSLWSRGAWSV